MLLAIYGYEIKSVCSDREKRYFIDIIIADRKKDWSTPKNAVANRVPSSLCLGSFRFDDSGPKDIHFDGFISYCNICAVTKGSANDKFRPWFNLMSHLFFNELLFLLRPARCPFLFWLHGFFSIMLPLVNQALAVYDKMFIDYKVHFSFLIESNA